MMPQKNHSKSRNVFIREAKKLGGKEFHTIPKLYISGDQDHLFLPFVIQNVYSIMDGGIKRRSD